MSEQATKKLTSTAGREEGPGLVGQGLIGQGFSPDVKPAETAGALQAAEKLDPEGGGGFNPRIKPTGSTRALAPEGRFSPISPEIPSFSAASFAPEVCLSRTQPTPRARVQAMKEYHPPLGSRDALRLDFNENTLACSPRVREVLGSISAGALTRYPEREPVEAIVAAHLGLAAPQVALTNGVDEAIHVLFETFLEAGHELLLPVPTYTMYEVYASATDARVFPVQAADDLQFPFERLLAAITPQTKIIALANPNSPSGSAATRAQLVEIASRAPHAVLLVDEAYFHFHGETVIDLVGVLPNLIVARTFSKAYGLAGLRLGLLAGPFELMRWVRRVLSPYSVNSLALACLPPALEDSSYIDWYVSEVLRARHDFEAALDAAKLRRWPSRANFILVDIGPKHAQFVRLMRAAGVLVRDRSSDPGCDGRVRITIGTREQMQQAVVALNEVTAALKLGGEAQ